VILVEKLCEFGFLEGHDDVVEGCGRLVEHGMRFEKGDLVLEGDGTVIDC
jgi:hypothetical protein